MSQDAEKIKKEFGRLEKMVPAIGKDAMRDIKKNFSMSDDMVGEAQKNIQDMVVEANEKGAVKGKNLADLMSYAGFKQAVAGYHDRANKHQLVIDKMQHIDKAAIEMEKQFLALQADITKKLSKIMTKLNPKLKKEIDDISKKTKGYIAEIKGKKSLCGGIPGSDLQIAKTWKKNIEQIVEKTSISSIKESRAVEMALRKLDDRVMKTACSKCAGFARDTDETVKQALDSYESDPDKARALVKTAATNVTRIKEIHDPYVEMLKDKEIFKVIYKNEDRGTILKRIDIMKKQKDAAEKIIKGAITSLKVMDKLGKKG